MPKTKKVKKSSPILDFLAKAFKPSGWDQILIMLLPLLEELFKQLMERCAQTEDQAVALLTDPRDFQLTRIEKKLYRKSRRDSSDFRRLSVNQRWQVVNEAVLRVHDYAVENPEAVKEVWRSVQPK